MKHMRANDENAVHFRVSISENRPLMYIMYIVSEICTCFPWNQSKKTISRIYHTNCHSNCTDSHWPISTITQLKRWPPLAVFGLRSPERLHEECGDTTGLQQMPTTQRLYLPKDRNIEGFRNTLTRILLMIHEWKAVYMDWEQSSEQNMSIQLIFVIRHKSKSQRYLDQLKKVGLLSGTRLVVAPRQSCLTSRRHFSEQVGVAALFWELNC